MSLIKCVFLWEELPTFPHENRPKKVQTIDASVHLMSDYFGRTKVQVVCLIAAVLNEQAYKVSGMKYDGQAYKVNGIIYQTRAQM